MQQKAYYMVILHVAMSTTPYERVILQPDDRVLVVAPHPDDEVLGCTGIIEQAGEMGLPVRIVFLTYGDANQWSFIVYRKWPVLNPEDVISMGYVRHDEALEAADVLKVSRENLTFLGYPDFGTENILCAHWGDNPPYRGLLTRVTEVPYNNALRPGALYKGEDVLKDLKSVINEFQPTKIFLSHPADHNRDHRALYVFTRVALWDLKLKNTPELYPYLVHYSNWPEPQGYYPTESLEPPPHLEDQIAWETHVLTSNDLKLEALKKHKSQYSSNTKYLLSFVRANELFGNFPPVELTTFLRSVMVQHHSEPSGELLDAERVHFVGIERYGINLQDGNLVFSVELSGPLAMEVEASVYLFGYRSGNFAEMPKLHVSVRDFGYTVYDQNRKLPHDVVQVSRKPKEISIRVPLEVLENPQKILASAKVELVEVPLDSAPWRVLDLTG